MYKVGLGLATFYQYISNSCDYFSSPSQQNKDPGGGVGFTSRLEGLGVEMGRFRRGDGWV